MKVLSPALDMQSRQIDNVADPSVAQDAATKGYVDAGDSSFKTITVTDAGTSTAPTAIKLVHDSTGTPTTNFGVGLWLALDSATISARDACQILARWSDALDATRTSYLDFLLVNNAGALASAMRLFASGSLSVGTTTDPGASGIINAQVGFRQGNVAFNFSHLAGAAATAQGGVPTGGATASILAKNSATNYDEVWLAQNSMESTAKSTSTTSTTGVMAGLGAAGSLAKLTPSSSGKVLLTITGYSQHSVAAGQMQAFLVYGTGTAPVSGAAVVGTATQIAVLATSGTASAAVPFAASTIVTLTPGTAYWFDLQYRSSSGAGTVTITSVVVCAYELP